MRFLSILIFSLFTITLQAQGVLVEMTFETTHIDLGKVKKGSKKDSSFVFVNTGNMPLEIDIVSSCECTELDWTRTPILPGNKGVISVIFDSSKKEVVEAVDVDVILKNTDPKTGGPVMEFLTYTYTLVE